MEISSTGVLHIGYKMYNKIFLLQIRNIYNDDYYPLDLNSWSFKFKVRTFYIGT